MQFTIRRSRMPAPPDPHHLRICCDALCDSISVALCFSNLCDMDLVSEPTCKQKIRTNSLISPKHSNVIGLMLSSMFVWHVFSPRAWLTIKCGLCYFLFFYIIFLPYRKVQMTL